MNDPCPPPTIPIRNFLPSAPLVAMPILSLARVYLVCGPVEACSPAGEPSPRGRL